MWCVGALPCIMVRRVCSTLSVCICRAGPKAQSSTEKPPQAQEPGPGDLGGMTADKQGEGQHIPVQN